MQFLVKILIVCEEIETKLFKSVFGNRCLQIRAKKRATKVQMSYKRSRTFRSQNPTEYRNLKCVKDLIGIFHCFETLVF